MIYEVRIPRRLHFNVEADTLYDALFKARERYVGYRNDSGQGASEWPFAYVYNDCEVPVGEISYNGAMWAYEKRQITHME